ncbi:MAG: hypothetical protein FH761_05975 [Firmicutes bacterium]|nr:hypothetical protein [Bacillota bacterium]
MENKYDFMEVQKPSKTVIQIFLLVFMISSLTMIINYLILENYTIQLFTIILSSIMLFFLILSHILKLTVMINEEGIRYKCRPFHIRTKIILFEDMQDIRIVKLKVPFRYYGFTVNYGLRGSIFLFGGYDGIVIKKLNSKIVVLGTKRNTEAQEIIKKVTRQDA